MGRTLHIGIWRFAAVLVASASLAACASGGPKTLSAGQKVGAPYRVAGKTYVPKADPHYDKVGTATWYGDAYHNRPTASGERFDMNRLTAAHTTLPLPSMVEVTNLENGRKVVVRVNDRGPFSGGRIIDLSRGAARALGFERQGLAKVRVRYIGPGAGNAPRLARAEAPPAPRPAGASDALFEATHGAVNPADTPPADRRPPDQLVNAPTISLSNPYRVQVGAFADPANARQAADRLSPAGVAVIEAVARDGVTFYRVYLPAPADEAQAFALRDQAAAYGFTEARVVRPAGL
ncbi:septal ring lytic transglycosylase RlpA family protein [Phenylobacterium immobile]|uniref:septal ring lytic transglycosylase RlpA family protein n=1 Tax=Phenylobacterium immobile TaxID=21 RepID=UPI000A6B3AE2|nr:septal ring lytic transglycosylase RlpA family protein [Phenylobacterium immobile]